MPSNVFIFLISWTRDEGKGSDIAGERVGMKVWRMIIVRLKWEVELGETVVGVKSQNCGL